MLLVGTLRKSPNLSVFHGFQQTGKCSTAGS
jgi:hypothetical protein